MTTNNPTLEVALLRAKTQLACTMILSEWIGPPTQGDRVDSLKLALREAEEALESHEDHIRLQVKVRPGLSQMLSEYVLDRVNPWADEMQTAMRFENTLVDSNVLPLAEARDLWNFNEAAFTKSAYLIHRRGES